AVALSIGANTWPLARQAPEWRLPSQKCSTLQVTMSATPATARWSAIRLDVQPLPPRAPTSQRRRHMGLSDLRGPWIDHYLNPIHWPGYVASRAQKDMNWLGQKNAPQIPQNPYLGDWGSLISQLQRTASGTGPSLAGNAYQQAHAQGLADQQS